jgi:hypothetical protein
MTSMSYQPGGGPSYGTVKPPEASSIKTSVMIGGIIALLMGLSSMVYVALIFFYVDMSSYDYTYLGVCCFANFISFIIGVVIFFQGRRINKLIDECQYEVAKSKTLSYGVGGIIFGIFPGICFLVAYAKFDKLINAARSQNYGPAPRSYPQAPHTQAQQRLCLGCGQQIPLNFNNCPHCGRSAQSWQNERNQPPPPNDYRQPASQHSQFPAAQRESFNYPPPPQDAIPGSAPHSTTKMEMGTLLERSVKLHVPRFIDTDTTVEIVIEMKNNGDISLKNVSLDLSDIKDVFEVDGRVFITALKPGMHLREGIKIKPKFKEGAFPVKIRIMCDDAAIEMEYSIKVGGTEIY